MNIPSSSAEITTKSGLSEIDDALIKGYISSDDAKRLKSSSTEDVKQFMQRITEREQLIAAMRADMRFTLTDTYVEKLRERTVYEAISLLKALKALEDYIQEIEKNPQWGITAKEIAQARRTTNLDEAISDLKCAKERNTLIQEMQKDPTYPLNDTTILAKLLERSADDAVSTLKNWQKKVALVAELKKNPAINLEEISVTFPVSDTLSLDVLRLSKLQERESLIVQLDKESPLSDDLKNRFRRLGLNHEQWGADSITTLLALLRAK